MIETKEKNKPSLNFTQRRAQYLSHVKENSSHIGRSDFWSQLSKEFEARYHDGSFEPVGLRAKAYSPILNKHEGWSLQERFLDKLSRVFKRLATKLDVMGQKRILFERAYKNVSKSFSESLTPYNHPLLGAPGCRLTPHVFRSHYFYNRIIPFVDRSSSPVVLEIGAGAGMMGVLFHHSMKAQYINVDLPEVLGLSSALIHSLFPNANILLPNEIDPSKKFSTQAKGKDFIFLWPDQATLVDDDYVDVAINTASFMEMKCEEIDNYFSEIQRTVKKGGIFYCCNRIEKRPGLGDLDLRSFFKYPWRPENKDLILTENELARDTNSHTQIERLQEIVK